MSLLRIACYLSDDAGSMLTFEAAMETANFARLWAPFCKKYSIEPRAPEMYFASVSLSLVARASVTCMHPLYCYGG